CCAPAGNGAHGCRPGDRRPAERSAPRTGRLHASAASPSSRQRQASTARPLLAPMAGGRSARVCLERINRAAHMKTLVVTDAPDAQDLVVAPLREAGFDVDLVADPAELDPLLRVAPAGAIVLDLRGGAGAALEW